MSKLDSVISDGLNVRSGFSSYGNKNQQQNHQYQTSSTKKHHSINCQSRQVKVSETQQSLGSKLSFSNVAQQILSNNSSCDKKKSLNHTNISAYDDIQQQQLN